MSLYSCMPSDQPPPGQITPTSELRSATNGLHELPNGSEVEAIPTLGDQVPGRPRRRQTDVLDRLGGRSVDWFR